MKLDLYIRECGYCSRRKAIELISSGKVELNGKIAEHNSLIQPKVDVVTIASKVITLPVNVTPVFIAYHKPKGIICTSEKIEGNILDAIKYPGFILPVGRLDKNSEGLILLTNQAALIDKIGNSAHQHEKEYLVTLNKPIRKEFLDDIQRGVDLDGEKTKPCIAKIEPGTRRILRITLTQGINRQIRRMCGMYKYQVIKLQRIRIMNLHLGNLNVGCWRELDASEVKTIVEQLSN